MTEPTAPPDQPAKRAALVARLRSKSIAQSMVFVVGASVATLALHFLTGVLNARLLGPDGRGELAAVMAWVMLVPTLLSLGVGEGIAYLQARATRPRPGLVTGALLAVAVFGTMSLLVAELLIPLGFAEQSDTAVRYARLAVVGVYFVLGMRLVVALFGSNNFFLAASTAQVVQPAMYAAGALVLWALGSYTVGNLLLVQVLSFAGVAIAGFALAAIAIGMGAIHHSDRRAALRYGARAHGATLGQLGNTRLDVAMMPAFLAAGEIGLYAVAVSVGSMMVRLFGQLNRVVFTNAAGKEDGVGEALVERSVRLVLTAATVCAVLVGVVAPPLISLVYGSDFAAAATPLRLLLPGLVLWTASTILASGLRALGHPGRASLAQLAGLVVTVGMLSWTIPRYGIDGAALTSSIAYATVFVIMLSFLATRRAFSIRRAFSPTGVLADARGLLARLPFRPSYAARP